MALKKLQHFEIEDDFKLIGIHCQLDGYKLAFNLNKFLKISLENFDYKIVIDNVEWPPNPKVLLIATLTSLDCDLLNVKLILGSISGSLLK